MLLPLSPVGPRPRKYNTSFASLLYRLRTWLFQVDIEGVPTLRPELMLALNHGRVRQAPLGFHALQRSARHRKDVAERLAPTLDLVRIDAAAGAYTAAGTTEAINQAVRRQTT